MTDRAVDAAAARVARLAEVVGAVARQALADRGARRIALLDDGSPEARLAGDWLTDALPPGALVRVDTPPAVLEPLLRRADGGARLRTEALRLAARLVDDAITANPINRTAMLLSGEPPPEPFLPLGDLFASQVLELAGDWSVPPAVAALAERAGGVAALDAALAALLDGRRPDGLDALPPEARGPVRAALDRGRAARRAHHVVPKMGYRTLGVDLFS